MADPLGFEMSVNGGTIEAAWWGARPEAAPTIVMLHEGLGCIALWRDVPAQLAKLTGCGVLAYSRFGYGSSSSVRLPRPLRYMHDEAQQVLGQVLERCGVQRAILLGHSDGGSIAAIYAGSVPDGRVRGLVLIAAHFFVESVTIESIQAAKRAYETTDLRSRLGRYHKDVDNAFWGWNGAWLDPAFRDWRIDSYVPPIRMPVQLLQGTADEYGTLAQFEAFQHAAKCPVETILIEGAGHAPQFSHPVQTLEHIAKFVGRVLPLLRNAG